MKEYLANFQPDLIPENSPVAAIRFGESHIPLDFDWTVFPTPADYASAIRKIPYETPPKFSFSICII